MENDFVPKTHKLWRISGRLFKGNFVAVLQSRSVSSSWLVVGNRVVLQESQSSASGSNQSQGLHVQGYYVVNFFHLVRSLESAKQFKNVHQMLLFMPFLEEPKILWFQFSSITLSCSTPCNPMNLSTPGLPVHHQLPESTQTTCRSTISSSVVPFSSCPQSFPASVSFLMSQLFPSGGQSIGVSASTSVLSMNTQDCFPLGWTGWISLQFKGLSRLFSNITVQKHQFFSAQLSL